MGTLVTPANIYETCAQMVKNANLKHPALFFTQPPTEMTGKEEEKEDPSIAVQREMVQVEREKTQVKAQKDQVDAQQKMIDMQQAQMDLQASHQREIARLENDREKLKDHMFIEMEKLRNQLTEMELKYATNVPGSKV
jgi:uncharacterized protein YPO0396